MASAVQEAGFDRRYTAPSPHFYFRHIIDAEAATLEVQVLGPGLGFTFSHSRARGKFPPSTIQARLEVKTTGFVSLGGSGKRIVLAWAESGHAAGGNGDILDAGGGALSNDVWARRAMAVADVLGLRMSHPFDRAGGDTKGVSRASHVEVKLAVHAVHVLLHVFDMVPRGAAVSRAHLERLRGARWRDGSRPAVEQHLSRKNCHPCGAFIDALARITGVEMHLVWHERLTAMEYPSSCRPAGLPQVDVANDTSSSPRHESLVDGIAYCIGQLDERPVRARAAIINLARRARRTAAAPIRKPLPATPETEPPVWISSAPRVRERSRRPYGAR